MKFLIIFCIIVLVEGGYSPSGKRYFSALTEKQIDSIPREIAEDALLDVVGLITKYGYSVQSHQVQTRDGYVLTMHRIPSGRNPAKLDEDRTPVFLMHGLLGSSADWIVNGPGKSLAYILSDEGFDVWLGNARGNFYSRNHSSLDPDGSGFWRFSWDEIGQIDLPTMIDYVLEKTERPKLHYVGHSQGTTSFFVMASTLPEYNDKVILMQAFAPVAYNNNARTPMFKYLAKYMSSMQVLLSIIGINELLPKSNSMPELATEFCGEDSEYLPLCLDLFFVSFGDNPEQLNTTMLPVYLSHMPAGASVRQFVHYCQTFVSGKFRRYDHGFILNVNKYNTLSPPRYNLKNIKAPVALHYSDNDLLAEPEDVFKLNGELSNSMGLFRVPDEKFNHLDFAWAIDAKTLLYDLVIQLMRANES